MLQLNLSLDASAGSILDAVVALDHSGREICRYPRRVVSSSWASVYRPLRDTLPAKYISSGKTLVHAEQDKHSVSAFFTDGSVVRGDVLIAADGIHSTVRRQLCPQSEPAYAGYVAWRGIVAEPDIPPSERELVFQNLIFSFESNEMMLCIPMPQSGSSGRRCCFLWYRPAERDTDLRRLCTDSTGRSHGVAIAPSLIREELLTALKAEAKRVFCPLMSLLVARAGQVHLQAIFDLEVQQMVFGRIALLGDAAFVARPHAVAGVTKAAVDAQTLAVELKACGDSLQDGLRRYAEERIEFGRQIVGYARRLGAHLQSQTGHGVPDRSARSLLGDYRAPYLLHDPVSDPKQASPNYDRWNFSSSG